VMDRIELLRAKLDAEGCDAFFSLSPPTNQYLTGFTGSTSAVIVTMAELVFLCDFRYTEQAGKEVSGFTIEEIMGDLVARTAERLGVLNVRAVAFDPNNVTVAQLGKVHSVFSGSLNEDPKLMPSLRVVKSADEIARIRAASELAEGVLKDLLDVLDRNNSGSSEVTEQSLAADFEYAFKTCGASGASFDTIALFGARSSLPHGQPGGTPLKKGDIILLDFGCRLSGYCSDLTRTYAYGTIPGTWFDEIYGIVLAAQEAALQTVRPGVRCHEVDAVAREKIREAGYAKHFGHGLGHGVGIEVHEDPRLNFTSQTVLEEGMVVTVEPGIYLPGRGGVRIEDLVVVTKEGCEVLSHAPKELRILGV